MTLGERLKILRESHNFSRQELAEKLGLSYWAIAKYEQDERDPDHDILSKMANLFGVTVDYLLGRSDYPHLPDTSKIDGALETDPELLDFWRKLKKRPELQLLARQAKDAPPEDIRKMMRILKAIEDEEASGLN
ncbi:MAG: helix-turn-helix transcriptional regulator [Bacillota bacterium]|jgi:transcriptional regulator with XRE-family HTH domain